MSEHTQGRLVAKHEWLVPEIHQDRPIGNSSNPIHDRDNYAQVVAQVRGKYHDQDANARRLAAAWNACEGMTTENLESIVFVGETIRIRFDFINAELRQAQAELNAARALLREVIADTGIVTHIDACQRAQEYLDACDTLEGNKPIEATGCRKCGDILPAGHYCKAPACPLNPSMKGES